MAEGRQDRIILLIEADLLLEIDNFRYAHRVPARSEAMRILLRVGLTTFAQDAAAMDRVHTDTHREAAAP